MTSRPLTPILAAAWIAGFLQAMAQTSPPPGPTVYRLESGSSYQRGCGVFQVMTLSLLGDVPSVQMWGRVEGTADLPRIEMTLTANAGAYDDVVLVLKASPVPPDRIQWYRLIGGSEYIQQDCFSPSRARPLSGTFGLIEEDTGSQQVELVQVRWSAVPPAGTIDPSRLFLTGAGGGGPRLALLVAEDNRSPFLIDGMLPAAGPVVEFSLTGSQSCQQRTVRARAKRD